MIEYEMLSLHETPPGGWDYTVAATGFRAKHYDAVAFFNMLREHHLANHLPLEENWKARVVDEMIKANMATWHSYVRRIGKPRKRKGLSFGAIISGLNVFKDILAAKVEGKSPRVSQEEAERRASICSTCDQNTRKISFSCGGCASLFEKTIHAVAGEMKTPYDSQLGSCSLCSCTLKAAVHIDLKMQQDALSEDVKAQFRDPAMAYCWKAESL